MRVFLGLPLPEDVTLALDRAAGQLRTGRRVDPDSYHLTLAFLGDQQRPALEDLHMDLEARPLPRGKVTIRGLGSFGSDPMRVAHAEVLPDPGLTALRDRCRAAARAAGIVLPHERFHPHVTLARLGAAADPGEVLRFLGREGGLSLPPFAPEALVLWRSHLRPEGPLYEELARYPLGV